MVDIFVTASPIVAKRCGIPTGNIGPEVDTLDVMGMTGEPKFGGPMTFDNADMMFDGVVMGHLDRVLSRPVIEVFQPGERDVRVMKT